MLFFSDLWVILQDKIFQNASCDKRFERSSGFFLALTEALSMNKQDPP